MSLSKAFTDGSPASDKQVKLGVEVLSPSKAFTEAMKGVSMDFRDTLSQDKTAEEKAASDTFFFTLMGIIHTGEQGRSLGTQNL